MKKANPEIVGKLPCGTCGDVMEVRQRSNGKKLLYTYCPNCKMDQRSGAAIQEFWRANMVAPDAEITTLKPEPAKPSPASVPATVDDAGDGLGEWVPPEELDPSREQLPPDETGGGTGGKAALFLGGFVVLCLGVLGIRARVGG